MMHLGLLSLDHCHNVRSQFETRNCDSNGRLTQRKRYKSYLSSEQRLGFQAMPNFSDGYTPDFPVDSSLDARRPASQTATGRRCMVSPAQTSGFDAIADLNVEGYREFADHMSHDGWRGMEASLRAVEARAQSTRFLVTRDQETIVGFGRVLLDRRRESGNLSTGLGSRSSPRGLSNSPWSWHRSETRIRLYSMCA